MESTDRDSSNIAKASAELDEALNRILDQADMAIAQFDSGLSAGKAPRPKQASKKPLAEPSSLKAPEDDPDALLPPDEPGEMDQVETADFSAPAYESSPPLFRPPSQVDFTSAVTRQPPEPAWNEAGAFSFGDDTDDDFDVSVFDEEPRLAEEEQPPIAIDLSVAASFADDQVPLVLDITGADGTSSEARHLIDRKSTRLNSSH